MAENNKVCIDCGVPHLGDPDGLCAGCRRIKCLEENLKDYIANERRLRKDFDELQKMLQIASKNVRLERSTLQRELGKRAMRKLKLHAPHLAIVQ